MNLEATLPFWVFWSNHAWFLARRRLLCSIPPAVNFHFQPDYCIEFWTDASVLWANRFWLTVATFAVVDINLQVCKKGVVNYPSLSSYVAELWGLLQACLLTPFRVRIFCDNKAVVEHAQHLFQTGDVESSWMCQEWWSCLSALTRVRKQQHPHLFQVQWIPAHCFEHLPIAKITPAMAASRRTTVRDIERNRIAELTAKAFASALSSVHPQLQHDADRGALQHQQWLAKLHELLPTSSPLQDLSLPEPEPELDFEHYQVIFPQWAWDADIHTFPRKPKIPLSFPKPRTWDGSLEDWETTCTFLRNLRWRVSDDEVTSLCELTGLFHHLGHKFDTQGHDLTYLDYHKKIRRAIVLLCRSDAAQVVPGTMSASESLAKAAGRTTPQGSIVGASVYAGNDALMHLAQVSECGAGRTLASWDVSLL